MAIGDVKLGVTLDQPGAVFCGSDSDIRGQVLIEYKPRQSSNPELFSPVEVFVMLSGRAESEITHKNRNEGLVQTISHRGQVSLVAEKIFVYRGSIRLISGQPQIFKFTARFPDRLQAQQWDSFPADPRFNTDPSGPLPPTMSSEHYESECSVEYRLGAGALIRGIDVKIHNFGDKDDGLHIKYEQPRATLSVAQGARLQSMCEVLHVSNEFLLPEWQRPNGFRENVKALFTHHAFPDLFADISIDGFANLQLGEPVRLDVRITVDKSKTTAVELPEITIANAEVTIKSCTELRSDGGSFSMRDSTDYEEVAKLPLLTHDGRPLSEANDYTKVFLSEPLKGMPSTFSTFNITRTYTMTIKMTIEAATETKKMKFKDIPVSILPPLAYDVKEAPVQLVNHADADGTDKAFATYANPADTSYAGMPPSYQTEQTYCDEKKW